jgi:hypothetical protein
MVIVDRKCGVPREEYQLLNSLLGISYLPHGVTLVKHSTSHLRYVYKYWVS